MTLHDIDSMLGSRNNGRLKPGWLNSSAPGDVLSQVAGERSRPAGGPCHRELQAMQLLLLQGAVGIFRKTLREVCEKLRKNMKIIQDDFTYTM